MSSVVELSQRELDDEVLFGDGGAARQRRLKSLASASLVTQTKADLRTATKYVVSEASRNRAAFCIGSFTVFLVVMFITLLQAAIARSPIVFMKLAETEVGEYDVQITPSGGAAPSFVPTNRAADISAWLNGTDAGNASSSSSSLAASVSSGFLLNFTEVERRTRTVATLVGTSPRWLGLTRVVRPDNSSLNSTAILLVIDSKREAAIGLGRTWTHRELADDEAHVSAVVLRRIGVDANANQNVSLVVDLLGLAAQIAGFDTSDPIAFLSTLAGAGGAAGGDQLAGAGAALAGLRNFTLASVVARANNATNQNFTVDALARYLYGAFGVVVPPQLNFSRPLVDLAWDAFRDSLILRRSVKVIDAIDSPGGKFAKALGNVVVVERGFLRSVVETPLANFASTLRTLQNSPLRIAAEFALNISDTVVQDLFNQVVGAVERAEQFELDHYALSIVGMYTERLTTYVGTKDSIDIDMIRFTNDIGDAVGYGEPIAMQTTLATAMGALYFVRLFLDQIFTFASIVLIGLGAMLIYSLLLSNVEEKTYEYGMLRAQGMRQHVLIELLLIQSLLFAVPGILVGLAVAYVIYLPLEAVVQFYVNVPFDARISSAAIGIGVAVGVLMPIVANVGPISRALQRSLRDSLDKYHSENDTVKVTIIALSKVGLAPWQVVLSVLTIVMGFVVYYLMPYSFIFNDIPLFLFLLTIILLGMLLGLSLVAQTLQPTFERALSWLYMWGGEFRRLRPLVLKGLHAHRRRNRKTALMFTTALAFIIFVGTSFSLQEHSIADNIQLASGSDIVVLSLSERFPVNKDAMAEYLRFEMARRVRGDADAFVLGFSYQTYELARYPFIGRTDISNLAGYPSLRCRVVGLEENFIDESYASFFRPSEVASALTFNRTRTGEPDIVQSLYRNAGKLKLPIESRRPDGDYPPDVGSSNVRLSDDAAFGGSRTAGYVLNPPNSVAYTQYVDVALSEALRLRGAIDTTTPLLLSVQYDLTLTNSTSAIYLAKAQGMIRKMAGEASYSSYRQLAENSRVVVSIDQYKMLLRELRNASAVAVDIGKPKPTGALADAQARAGLGGAGPEPQIERLFVRVDAAAGEREREAIINSLRNFIRDDLTQVLDTRALVDSTAFAISLLQYFFIVVTAIAVILCFFVLWLSFTANIRENAWEFGVLRAVGLTAAQVIRVYVYEAIALISSSLLLGTLIGMAQALTLTLQFNLFTELPFTFDFPYPLFIVVVVMSVAVAVLGSYLPALKFKRKRIASVLKGQ
jgi:ABC-type antimicrobial peptide transport system permease subunit